MKLLSFLLAAMAFFSVSCQTTQKKETTNELFQFNANDFLDRSAEPKPTNQFTLNEDPYLSMSFTLEQPLVKSLSALAPDLSEAELLERGNFQFSFYVDNELIYTENLNKGAGSPVSKTSRLQHTVPLIYPERIDFWRWYMWLRFMRLNGSIDALDSGKHALTIEVRPYLEQETLKVGDILAKGSLDMDVREPSYDAAMVPIQEIQPGSGWTVSSDSYDRDRIEALNKKIAQGRFENINGIVVIKNGELLIEEYFNGADRESLHNPRSVGKTIASTVAGIAIADGHLESEGMTLDQFYDLKSFKNYAAKKDKVTLKSLLTMTSGFIGDDDDYENPGNEEFMYPKDDWVKFTLDLPMADREIGEAYAYFTAGVVVLGDVLHKSVPGGLVDYADEKLFKPMGITNYQWQYTPQKVGNTAGGIQLRAVDFAKYGQLYKNKGNWNGRQILTEEWVSKSLSQHIKQPFGEDNYYGYLFWNRTYEVNGEKHEVYYCTGNGGNKIFIFNDLPYVIVITASAYGMPYAHINVDTMMTDYILPAILNE